MEKTEYHSILKFNLWEPGKNTLVMQIIKTKNIPESKYLEIDLANFFVEDECKIAVKNNYQGPSKDMVKIFLSSEKRDNYVSELLKGLRAGFRDTAKEMNKYKTTIEHKFYFYDAVYVDGRNQYEFKIR